MSIAATRAHAVAVIEVPKTTPESVAPGKARLTVRALAAGLVFTLVYGAFEFWHFGVPNKISVGGDTDTISVFHYPLIWLLSSLMLLCTFYAVGSIRNHTLREHTHAFGLSTALAVLIALFWAVPLISRLTMPVDDSASCTASEQPTTDPVTIHYSKSGFCPVRLVVSAGTRVEFVVDEGASLHLSSPHPELSQKATGGTYSTTFTKEGTFSYSDEYSDSLHQFISELLGRTTSHQGVIKVVGAKQ